MVKKGSTFMAVMSFLIIVVIVVYLVSQAPHHPSQSVLGTSPALSAARLYPDPDFTPGDVFPDVSLDALCKPGYTKSVRNVSAATKRDVYQEYGISYPQPKGTYEADHFIPLELGGSNDAKNLWPEPASPKPGFHEKDVVENYLHKMVCDRKESLSQAQEEVGHDWYAVYKKIPDPQDYAAY